MSRWLVLRKTLTLDNATATNDGTAGQEAEIARWQVPRSTKWLFNYRRVKMHTIDMVLKDSTGAEISDDSVVRISVSDPSNNRIHADIYVGPYGQIKAGDLADVRKMIVPQRLVGVAQDWNVILKVNSTSAVKVSNCSAMVNCDEYVRA